MAVGVVDYARTRSGNLVNVLLILDRPGQRVLARDGYRFASRRAIIETERQAPARHPTHTFAIAPLSLSLQCPQPDPVRFYNARLSA
jgi:hypothetical protein